MTAFGFPQWILLCYVFVVGTVVGSFLNVCIYRIPTKDGFWDSLKAIVYPPSRCPRCFNRIPGRFNIPIFGWLFLRGRCYHCSKGISWRYPAIELGNGLLWVLVYWMEIPSEFRSTIVDSNVQGLYGPTPVPGSGWLSPDALLHWRYLYHMILVEALVVASFIDLDLWVIPDGCTLPAMAAGIVGGGAIGRVWLAPVWHQSPRISSDLQWVLPEWMHAFFMDQAVPDWISGSPHLHGLAVSLAGFVVGGGVTWALRILGSWALRREAMGFGDVVLMAMIGSFLGWQASIMVFFIAPMIALVVVVATWVFRRSRELPFGPYLSLAALYVTLFWKPLWQSFEPIFGSGPLLVSVSLVIGLLFAGTMRLIRLLFETLGFATYDDELPGEEWTSADQLTHFMGENVDPDQGRWPYSRWPGESSGRGWSQYEQWKNG
ncbi:MAG: prepilin peptidase [Planctomycetota bacterium]|nr:prepilin peptidase [Planctomycetota bacterium]MDA1252312.1 prepilin peptidase [Planctomycetota bacterium]